MIDDGNMTVNMVLREVMDSIKTLLISLATICIKIRVGLTTTLLPLAQAGSVKEIISSDR